MENRGRRPGPNYHYRQDWRSKGPGNFASHRYSREFILRHYQNLPVPAFQFKDQIAEVLLNSPNPPLLTAVFPFAHALGDEPNSRKYPLREKKLEQMPEWYDDEEPKEPLSKPVAKAEAVEKVLAKEEEASEVKVVVTDASVKNFTEVKMIDDKDLEEKFTQIDLQVEEKLKNVQNEDDYAMPDWDEPTKEEFTFEPIQVVKQPPMPIYDINLLRYHFAIGNPFAQTLLDFGVPYKTNAITFTPGTKPFEKIWFYKDLEGQVHGPFSTLEMFAWTIRDCFPPDLEIAIGNSMFFVPMNIFNSVPQIPEHVFYPPTKKTGKEPKTLQEIESQQHTQLGKGAGPKQEHKKQNRTDETATFQLKSMLGITKKGK